MRGRSPSVISPGVLVSVFPVCFLPVSSHGVCCSVLFGPSDIYCAMLSWPPWIYCAALSGPLGICCAVLLIHGHSRYSRYSRLVTVDSRSLTVIHGYSGLIHGYSRSLTVIHGTISPGVIFPGVISPGVLSPTVLSPSVLSPRVLTPGCFLSAGYARPFTVDSRLYDQEYQRPGILTTRNN